MTKTTVRPIGDRILIKRSAAEDKTPGGIFIPETSKDPKAEGEVIAVGRGRVLDNGRLVEPSVKAGDKVLFGRYSGTEIVVAGEKLHVVREEDVLGVIEDA